MVGGDVVAEHGQRPHARQRALAVLVASRDRAAAPVIHEVFAEKTTPSFRRALIQALATVGDAEAAARVADAVRARLQALPFDQLNQLFRR